MFMIKENDEEANLGAVNRSDLVLADMGNAEIKDAYLMKSGQFLITTQVCFKLRSARNRIRIYKAPINGSVTTLQPIMEYRLDIYPTTMQVTPDERYLVVCDCPREKDGDIIYILFRLDWDREKPTLVKKERSLFVRGKCQLDYGKWCRDVVCLLTDSKMIFITPRRHIGVMTLTEYEDLAFFDNKRCGFMKKELFMPLVNFEPPFLLSYHSSILALWTDLHSPGKIITDCFARDEKINVVELFLMHQNRESRYFAMSSLRNLAIYVISINNDVPEIIQDVSLFDYIDILFESRFSMIDIIFNPYNGDFYTLLEAFEFGSKEKHFLYSSNIFRPKQYHMVELSNVSLFNPILRVNWRSQEVLIVSCCGKIFGYRMPVSDISLQSQAKRVAHSLYTSGDIQQLDIPAFLKDYLLCP